MGLPEFRGSAPVLNIKSPATMSCVIYIMYKLVTKNLHLVTIFLQLGDEDEEVRIFLPWSDYVTRPHMVHSHKHYLRAKANSMLAFLQLNSVMSFTTDHWELP